MAGRGLGKRGLWPGQGEATGTVKGGGSRSCIRRWSQWDLGDWVEGKGQKGVQEMQGPLGKCGHLGLAPGSALFLG